MSIAEDATALIKRSLSTTPGVSSSEPPDRATNLVVSSIRILSSLTTGLSSLDLGISETDLKRASRVGDTFDHHVQFAATGISSPISKIGETHQN